MALGSTFVSLLILSFFYFVNATSYKEVLLMGQSIRNSDTLVSKGGNCELRFFPRIRENSTKYYLGIRFTKVPNDKIVWVERYSYLLVTSSALLTIEHDGNIVITDGNYTYGVTEIQNSNSIAIYATLLDTGNFVLLNNSNQAILWQSFDSHTDTLLPGMKIGPNIDTGDTWEMISWTSEDDPTWGDYTLEYLDSGSLRLSNKKSSDVLLDGNQFGLQQSDKGYSTLPLDSNSRLILEVSGDLKYEAWSEESKSWVVLQSSKCATDNSCGKFSICNPQALEPCQCLNGFESSDADSWVQGDTSAGCVRINDLSCSKDRFLYMLVESPLPHMNLQVGMAAAAQCNYACFTNCSCVAYAYDILGGTCMLWNDRVPTLKNTSTDTDINGNNIKTSFHLRLAGSDRLITSKLKEPTFPLSCYLSHVHNRIHDFI